MQSHTDHKKEATGLALSKDRQGIYLNFTFKDESEKHYRAVLITEYLLTIWRKRCAKRLEDARVTSQNILASYKAALKTRILADHKHLDTDTFEEFWCSRLLQATVSSSRWYNK
jgi:hypothetical protein